MRLRRKDWEEAQEFIIHQWSQYNQELEKEEENNRNDNH